MENVQKDLLRVLLDRIRVLGLISDSECSQATDLLYSTAALPPFFRPAEETGECGCT